MTQYKKPKSNLYTTTSGHQMSSAPRQISSLKHKNPKSDLYTITTGHQMSSAPKIKLPLVIFADKK
tara:strand:- start:167 stop:364 length:198 start_codon:yes stop_codon:yes gene_type:complete